MNLEVIYKDINFDPVGKKKAYPNDNVLDSILQASSLNADIHNMPDFDNFSVQVLNYKDDKEMDYPFALVINGKDPENRISASQVEWDLWTTYVWEYRNLFERLTKLEHSYDPPENLKMGQYRLEFPPNEIDFVLWIPLNPKLKFKLLYSILKKADKDFRIYWKKIKLVTEGISPFTVTCTETPVPSIIRKKMMPSANLPDDVYEDVILTLSSYGKELEKKPKIYRGQDEEGIRDHFLSVLCGRYEKAVATGESFNKEGKTDILIKDDNGNNLFVAECKWWRGPAGFHDAITQLFDNYLSWRDGKVALLFFVENKNFTSVLSKIDVELKKHCYFIKLISKREQSRFSILFRQKDDLIKIVKAEIMFFHFPM